MHQLRREIGVIPAWAPAGAVDFVLRLALGAILLYASADKLIHPAEFAAIVKDYRLLPEALVNPVAVWLPWFELVLGACLYAGVLAEGALALATGLLGTFWVALIVNYFRGIDVGCGCFTSTPGAGETLPMLWYIGRDALILALALAACATRWRVAREFQK